MTRTFLLTVAAVVLLAVLAPLAAHAQETGGGTHLHAADVAFGLLVLATLGAAFLERSRYSSNL